MEKTLMHTCCAPCSVACIHQLRSEGIEPVSYWFNPNIHPYQQHERMAEIAWEMGERYGVRFLYRDFRPGFRAGQQEARELGFYMQKYCGCVFSEEERYLKQIQRDMKEPLKHIG